LTPEQREAIVLRHIVGSATVIAADVTTGPFLTLGGETIDLIKTEEGGVQISYMNNIVNVVTADVMASNGVIHVIDAVILAEETTTTIPTTTKISTTTTGNVASMPQSMGSLLMLMLTMVSLMS
jgi:hypothetical protein